MSLLFRAQLTPTHSRMCQVNSGHASFRELQTNRRSHASLSCHNTKQTSAREQTARNFRAPSNLEEGVTATARKRFCVLPAAGLTAGLLHFIQLGRTSRGIFCSICISPRVSLVNFGGPHVKSTDWTTTQPQSSARLSHGTITAWGKTNVFEACVAYPVALNSPMSKVKEMNEVVEACRALVRGADAADTFRVNKKSRTKTPPMIRLS